MVVAKMTRLKIQQEDVKMLNAAIKLTMHSLCSTWLPVLYSAEEFFTIQKVLKHSCLTLKKRFATALLDPVDSVPIWWLV